MNWIKKHTKLFFLASLTLGLGPFFPEPHIIGKLRWIAGGAKGMKLMDWLDFLMHSTPWVLLFLSLTLRLKNPTEKKVQSKDSE